MAVFNSWILSWAFWSIWAWVTRIVWASLVQFWIKFCVWIEVCKAMPVTAAVGQMTINPQMPRINHPLNSLDCHRNLVSNQQTSPTMGPSPQGCWRSTGNHRLHQAWRIKRDLFCREIEELRQEYNLQSIQVIEPKVLLNYVSYGYNKSKGNASLYRIWMIIMEGIVTMTMTGPCEISSPSSKFFSTCSKFPYVSLFRPNPFIEDDLRARRCHFTTEPAKESFCMEVFHWTVGNLLCYLNNIITHSTINIIWAVR